MHTLLTIIIVLILAICLVAVGYALWMLLTNRLGEG